MLDDAFRWRAKRACFGTWIFLSELPRYYSNPNTFTDPVNGFYFGIADRMAEVLSPGTAPSATKILESKETLTRSLDDLLERYLRLLDQHQKLQQDLNRYLSNVHDHPKQYRLCSC